MYISKVTLKDVRCFKQITLDLDSKKRAKMWAVIVGDNGEGKTTVLRSIAMGICDESSAAGLLRELPGEFIRRGADEAKNNC